MAKSETRAPEQPNSQIQPDLPPDPKAEERDPLTGQPEDAGKVAKHQKWSPPKVDEKTGLTMVGGYPLSGPARAIALGRDGKDEDPDGLVTPETIKAFKEA